MTCILNMKLKIFGIIAIMLVFVAILGCVEPNVPNTSENPTSVNIASTQIPSKEIYCNALRQSFDDYIEKSEYPIFENESICYGLNMSSDLSKIPPKWGVGKLINVRKENDYWLRLTFEGMNKSGTIQIPMTDLEAIQYVEGKYYKIDMNNACRYIFMMMDSRYPSSIIPTFVKHEEIKCK